MKKHHRNKIRLLKYTLWGVAFVAIILLITYSILQYYDEKVGQGVIVCNERECLKTLHMHADIDLELCGEPFKLPRETGPLTGVHTHKEKNYLHFEDKIQLDPETKAEQFDKRLTIQEVVDVFGLDPKKFCLGTAPVQINVLVNGSENSEGLQYRWKDQDQIKLIYTQ